MSRTVLELQRLSFTTLLWMGVAFFVFSCGVLRAETNPLRSVNASYFIENVGQWNGDFQFKCEVGSTVYYVTPKGMTIDFREFKRIPLPPQSSGGARGGRIPSDLDPFNREKDSITVRGHVVQIHYLIPPQSSGGVRGGQAVGDEKLSHYSNYFFGRDSTKWRSRVGHYRQIIVPKVWPGIDVEYRADKQGVETIYHVKPGADPSQIQMEYLGLDAQLRVDTQGNLVLATSLGDMKEKAPFAFQQEVRVQQRVDAGFQILGENRIAYMLSQYNSNKPLTIDPLLYGTYLGGGGPDDGGALAPAHDNGVYIAGEAYAMSGFPTTPGAYDETGLFEGYRLFCTHISADGQLVASTLFGETQTQVNPHTEGAVTDIVVDSVRNSVWVCGWADPGWPLTEDALDTVCDEGTNESFIVRFSADLTTLQYCSYLGGNHHDEIQDMALDGHGRLHLVGSTYSLDFPVTPDALYPNPLGEMDATWLIFDPDVPEYVYSTRFGGSMNDEFGGLSITDSQHVWLHGQSYSGDLPVTPNAFQDSLADNSLPDITDAFMMLVTLDPPTLQYCSYLGGEDYETITAVYELDSVLYLSGGTSSTDFPVTAGTIDTVPPGNDYDAFVARLNWRTGDYMGTFLGGSEGDLVSSSGEWVNQTYITLVGGTASPDFPVTPDAYDNQINHNGSEGFSDAFVVKLRSDLTEILYGTFIGGSDSEMAIIGYSENADSVWITGGTWSFNIPVTPNAIQPGDNPLTSAFVFHFAIDTTGSFAQESVFPNEFSLIAYPNPFNPVATLSFTLPRSAEVALTFRNVLGQEVESVNMGRMSTGEHRYAVNAERWASGIYFASVEAGEWVRTVKMVVLK